jgi:hypothetical protein
MLILRKMFIAHRSASFLSERRGKEFFNTHFPITEVAHAGFAAETFENHLLGSD